MWRQSFLEQHSSLNISSVCLLFNYLPHSLLILCNLSLWVSAAIKELLISSIVCFFRKKASAKYSPISSNEAKRLFYLVLCPMALSDKRQAIRQVLILRKNSRHVCHYVLELRPPALAAWQQVLSKQALLMEGEQTFVFSTLKTSKTRWH